MNKEEKTYCNTKCVEPDYKQEYYRLQEQFKSSIEEMEFKHNKELDKIYKELEFYKDIIKSILHIERR